MTEFNDDLMKFNEHLKQLAQAMGKQLNEEYPDWEKAFLDVRRAHEPGYERTLMELPVVVTPTLRKQFRVCRPLWRLIDEVMLYPVDVMGDKIYRLLVIMNSQGKVDVSFGYKPCLPDKDYIVTSGKPF